MPYTPEQIEQARASLRNEWTVLDTARLQLRTTFPTFVEAIQFVGMVATVAESMQHHPDIHIHYTEVTLELWTHSERGITDKDIALAQKIDTLL